MSLLQSSLITGRLSDYLHIPYCGICHGNKQGPVQKYHRLDTLQRNNKPVVSEYQGSHVPTPTHPPTCWCHTRILLRPLHMVFYCVYCTITVTLAMRVVMIPVSGLIYIAYESYTFYILRFTDPTHKEVSSTYSLLASRPVVSDNNKQA